MVSNQRSGIVLVWSAYNVGQGPLDQNFACHFIPKTMVEKHPGNGYVQFTYRGTTLIEKYVYIHDDKIVGNETNDMNDAISEGHSVDKRQTVLRYVIGV